MEYDFSCPEEREREFAREINATLDRLGGGSMSSPFSRAKEPAHPAASIDASKSSVLGEQAQIPESLLNSLILVNLLIFLIFIAF